KKATCVMQLITSWPRQRLVVATAAVFVAVVLGAVLINSFSDSESIGEEFDCRHAYLVALNSLAVANPDYRVDFGLTDDLPECADGIRSLDSMPLRLGVRSTEVASSDAGMLRSEIRVTDSRIHMPSLEPASTITALQDLDEENASNTTSQTLRLLRELDGAQFTVQATVVLKKPLTSTEFENVWQFGGGDVLLVSPIASGKPLGWPFPEAMCTRRGFNECNNEGKFSYTDGFKKWVSLLREEDKAILEAASLSLSELQASAADSHIYGFIMSNTADQVERLARHEMVRGVKVVSISPS
ncbi:hypothetical protein, partial [Nonomuraea longicatena]|uniref:hypothetical protein n=1 Tax=Nonomuraea longicatena TaxID=83682 RepID=UPI0031D35742